MDAGCHAMLAIVYNNAAVSVPYNNARDVVLTTTNVSRRSAFTTTANETNDNDVMTHAALYCTARHVVSAGVTLK